MDLKLVGLVGLGGAAGSMSRYVLSGWATRSDFPAGTLLVNVTGSLVIGFLVFGGLAGGWLTPTLRVLLAIGVLGGFTTMSSFSYDTIALLQGGETLQALLNVALTLFLCLGATAAGRALGILVWSGGN